MGEWQDRTDEQLASASSTGGNGQIAAIEMLRRVKLSNAELRDTMREVRSSIEDLKNTLHHEETVIKWLTWALVGLTVMLVFFGVVQMIDMHYLKGLIHSVIGPAG